MLEEEEEKEKLRDEPSSLEHHPTKTTEHKDDRCYTINRYMLPAKIAYFINNVRYSICDYMVLFYVQAGLSPSQAGVVNGLQHIGGMVAAPLFGLFADKYGHHRILTITLCILSLIAVCIQPYFTTRFGNPENKVCPTETNMSYNATKKVIWGLNNNGATVTLLFYSLFISAILASSFDGSIMSFIEVGVLTRVQNSPKKSNIGVQRVTAALGSSLGSLAYSFSITYFPHGNSSCYVGLFVTYSVFLICLCISFYFLFKGVSIKKEKKKKNVTSKLLIHLKKPRVIIFLLTVSFNGTVPAFMFSYLFLYLKQLNASTLLFGASISFNCVSGVVIYAISSPLIERLGGPFNTMCVSCFAWAIRLVSLAYLVNPYHVLLIDIFHGFTFSLFKVATLEYTKAETHVTIFSSMCGVVNALSYSLSFLLANVAGGKLFELYGPKNLYLGISVACLVWGVVMLCYILTDKLYGKKRTRDAAIGNQ